MIEAISALSNVILVTHSSSGMFALETSVLEKLLTGLILMDSAPDKSWQPVFQQYVKEHPLPEAEKKEKDYIKHRSNKTLQECVIAAASYCVTTKGLKKFTDTLKTLPFNYKTYEWANKNFHPTYKAKWVPKNIPVLIFAGDEDHITPLKLFATLEKFKRKNILIQEIKNAGHYPWIENPKQVITLFNKYCKELLYKTKQ